MRKKMYLIKHKDRICAAYPSRMQAVVYSTGFSSEKDVEIIEGYFIAKSVSESGVENDGQKDEPICIHCGRKYSERIEECFNFAPPAV